MKQTFSNLRGWAMQHASFHLDGCHLLWLAASRSVLRLRLLAGRRGMVAVVTFLALVLVSPGWAQAAEIQYTYDGIGRLTGAVTADGNSAGYDYDAAGNILAVHRNGVDALNITGFSPGRGSTGSTVTISGNGFDVAAASNTVRFAGIEASVSAATAASLTVIVPAGATTGKITIENARGLASSRTDYTVVAPLAPTISAIDPDVGMPGSTVSISGVNFAPGIADNKVTLNQRSVAVKSAESVLLNVAVPSQAGSGRFQVSTAYGTAASSTDFFIPPPSYGVQDIEVKGRMGFGDVLAIPNLSQRRLAMILFDSAAGQRASISLSDTTISAGTIMLIGPDGARIGTYSFWRDSKLIELPTLPVAGTYTIVVVAEYAGAMTLQLNAFKEAVGKIAIGGPPVTLATTVPGQNASLTFSGVAGQRISMLVSGIARANTIAMTLLRPDGTTMASSNYIDAYGAFFDVMELSLTGTYTITLDPRETGTGNVTVQLYDVPADVKADILPSGPAVVVTTASPGQNASLTFSGVMDQRISVRVSGIADTNAIAMTLLRPDGTSMTSYGYIGSYGAFIEGMNLSQTGIYTIKLDPIQMGTGSVTVQLYDVAADVNADILPGGPAVTVATRVPGQNATLTFSGVTGQRISMRISGITSPDAIAMTLLRPDGSTMASSSYLRTNGEFFDVMELSLTGTYTIRLDPQGMGTGAVTVQLYDVPEDVRADILPGGPAVTVATVAPGQNASLTFNGVAGQRISMRVSDITNSNTVAMTLLRPDGSTMASSSYIGRYGAFFDVMELSLTGTYTIRLDPRGTGTGRVTVQLNDVPAGVTADILPGGPAVAVATTVPGQNASLTFSGMADQRISLRVFGITNPNLISVTLLRPNGTTMASSSYVGTYGAFFDGMKLSQTGIYTLKLDPLEMGTGSVTVQLYEVPADVMAEIVPGEPAATVVTTVPSQNISLSFNGTTGQTIKPYYSDNGIGCLRVRLLNPAGALMKSLYSCSSSNNLGTQVLPSSGTYILNINPDGMAVGPLKVGISSP